MKIWRVLVYGFGLAFAMLFVGCSFSVNWQVQTGELSVVAGSPSSARAILDPDEPYDGSGITEYDISLTNGPGEDQAQTVPAAGASPEFILEVGDWTITVLAKNTNGTVIGSGTTTVSVVSGANTVTVPVLPLEGDGLVSLYIDYSATAITTPSLTLTFTNTEDSTTTVLSGGTDFTVGETASAVSTSLPAGVYFLDYAISAGSFSDLRENIQVVVRSNLITSATFTHSGIAALSVSIQESLSPTLYPDIAWQDDPDDTFATTRAFSEVRPARYDYGGLDFAVTYDGQTREFGFATYGVDGFFQIFSVEIGADPLDFFDGHTAQVTMIYTHSGGTESELNFDIVYEAGGILWSYPTSGLAFLPAGQFFDMTEEDGGPSDGDENNNFPLFAFKEIRLVAPDLVNYYTWTNPGL